MTCDVYLCTSHVDRPATTNVAKKWEDTSKLQGADARESTSHGERRKSTGIKHHENKKIVLNSIPSKNSNNCFNC